MSVIDKEIERRVDCEDGGEFIIKTLRCTDDDGDDFCVDIHGSNCVEIVAYHDSRCIVLNKAQAIELANKILSEVNS